MKSSIRFAAILFLGIMHLSGCRMNLALRVVDREKGHAITNASAILQRMDYGMFTSAQPSQEPPVLADKDGRISVRRVRNKDNVVVLAPDYRGAILYFNKNKSRVVSPFPKNILGLGLASDANLDVSSVIEVPLDKGPQPDLEYPFGSKILRFSPR